MHRKRQVARALERLSRTAADWGRAVTLLGLLALVAGSPVHAQPVEAAPPADWEVEQAVEVLRRFVDAEQAARERRALEAAERGESSVESSTAADRPPRVRPRDTLTARVPGPLAAPTLGPAALSLSGQLHLAADSAVFADDGTVQRPFLWSDPSGNLGFGSRALSANTTGAFNTAAGGISMLQNTEGSHNTAVGSAALVFNTVGSHNTAIGRAALSYSEADYNTGVGFEALRHNEAGSSNTAFGALAGRSNHNGVSNTAVGYRALFANTGFANTAAGAYALEDNTTGFVNTALGLRALADNVSGLSNTAVGVEALSSNTIASNNTAVGDRALENATGHRNTAFGASAGRNATTGSDNIFIGHFAYGESTDEDTIRIGTNTNLGGGQTRAFIAGIRGITTGNNNAIGVQIDSDGQLGTTSSSRALKQGIQPVGELSQRLLDLRPVAFRYRRHVEQDPDTRLQFGLIAEDVAEAFPELTVTDGRGRPQTVRYHLLSVLLLNELRRLAGIERGLEVDLARQRRQVQALESRIAKPRNAR